MGTLESLNLRYNPFKDVTPTMDGGERIWASMNEVKTKIERSYNDCVLNNSKQIVLNWGPYGGGKTFSAYYFIGKNKQQSGLTHIYLRSPKDGSRATNEFFKAIIDYLSFEDIHKHIKSLLGQYGEEHLMDFLTPKASHEYAKAICLIGSSDSEIKDIMNRFLYAGLTKTELKKLGLAKAIVTDSDSVKFLVGLLSCFIGTQSMPLGKVILWIDEMEDMIYYSPKYYKAFSQVLRDILDSITEGFLVFLNFTLAEGEESTIELILGAAVWSRIIKKIRYKQFSENDALEYCDELLKHSRIKKSNSAPFDTAIVRTVVNYIPANILTPRELNKHFNSLINFSMEHDLKAIDKTVVKKWMQEYEEDN